MTRLDRGGCEEFGPDAAPYVLGALTEAEHEAFRAHLQDCASCREEVAELQSVASVLPAAVPQRAAPAELKGRVMRTVNAEAGLRGRGDAARGRRRGASPSRRARPSRWARPSWPARPSWRTALGAAAAFVAGAILALAMSGGHAGTRLIRARVTYPRASALLRVSGSNADLQIAGMPQSPPGQVYELWVKRAGGPEPTDALFTVSSAGRASVGVPGGVRGVTAVMVTAEPRGGTRLPTTPPVIVATV